MRIVVVDDEPDARELARLVLERAGHEVYTARHPDEALQVLAQHTVDVVLTDLHMPRMTGEQLAARVAELHPEVTCIIWSTLADPEPAPDAGGGGGVKVRPKDVMHLRIEEWVGDRPQGAEGTGSTTADDAPSEGDER